MNWFNILAVAVFILAPMLTLLTLARLYAKKSDLPKDEEQPKSK